MDRCVVTYGGLALRLAAPDAILAAVGLELEPFFSFEEDHDERPAFIATVFVHQQGLPDALRPHGPGSEVVVDTSLYAHLASRGERWGDATRYIIHIRVSDSWVQFDKAARRIDLHQPVLESCVLETVRLIKGLFTPALENTGAVQLHGSAAVGDGGCILILGDMWHGKTTLLLEMLAHFNVAQLSCDTIVLSTGETGGILASGWPSPFSVSHGTMADFPELYPLFPAARRQVPYARLWEERKKEVLASSDVVARFGSRLEPRSARIDVCLLVRFAPLEPTGIEPVSDGESVAAFLRAVYLGSRDPIYHNWHCFLECDAATIDRSIEAWARRLVGIDTYRMTWAPSAVSLMKRVPRLARLHTDLAKLLAGHEQREWL